jgi:hypothetical protein
LRSRSAALKRYQIGHIDTLIRKRSMVTFQVVRYCHQLSGKSIRRMRPSVFFRQWSTKMSLP